MTTPSNIRGMAPHYVLTAEVLDGLGITEGTGSADFTFEAQSGDRSRCRAHADPGTAVRRQVRRPASRPLPVGPPTCRAAALPREQRQGTVGPNARGWPGRICRLQRGRPAHAGRTAQDRAARARSPNAARDRRHAPQRRRRQHDVRTTDDTLRLAEGRSAREALRPDWSRDVLRGGELRRRARSRHAGDDSSANRREGVSRRMATPSRSSFRRSAGTSTSQLATTSASAVPATTGSRSSPTSTST